MAMGGGGGSGGGELGYLRRRGVGIITLGIVEFLSEFEGDGVVPMRQLFYFIFCREFSFIYIIS